MPLQRLLNHASTSWYRRRARGGDDGVIVFIVVDLLASGFQMRQGSIVLAAARLKKEEAAAVSTWGNAVSKYLIESWDANECEVTEKQQLRSKQTTMFTTLNS